MLVTIRGMSGSGVKEIGKEVARLIEGDYVDREIMEHIAKLVGHPIDQVVKKESIEPGLAARISTALSNAFERTGSTESAYQREWKEPLIDEKYLYALKSVIESLALERSIVIQGRGSQFILKNHPSALHVLVIAPSEDRIKRVMAMEQIDGKSAKKVIQERDRSRRLFIRRFFQQDIEDPIHYDLIINTRRVQFAAAARVIACAAREKQTF